MEKSGIGRGPNSAKEGRILFKEYYGEKCPTIIGGFFKERGQRIIPIFRIKL